MYKLTHKLFFVMVLIFSTHGISYAETNTHILTSEQWNIPREASSIIEMPAIRAAMHAFQTNKNSKIMVKYPGGDVGTLWAHELRSWLISLGLSGKYIELVPGSANPDQLELVILKSSY